MDSEEKKSADGSCDFVKKSFELKNLKLYKEAIEMLYKALGSEDIGDSTIEIISQIGDLYFLLKNYERAIEQYQKVLEINRLHKHTLFQMCKIYFLQKKYNDALYLIEDLCKNSSEIINFIQYFKILYELKMYDKMKELYKNLNPEFQKNEDILYIMSLSSEDKKQFLKKTIETSPKHIKARFDLGVVEFLENHYTEAKEHFDFVVKNEKNAAANNYLGLVYQRQGDYKGAIENFYQATKFDKTKGLYFFNLARAYIDIRWFDEAQSAILKSLRLSQFDSEDEMDLGELYYSLGWINWQKKNYKNALLNLNLVEKKSKMHEEAQILKNIIEFEMGDIVSAKIKLENLFEKNEENKGNSNLLSALGRVYNELKMYEKAIKIYLNALEICPLSYEFLIGIIESYIDNKEYDNAVKYITKFQEIYPTSAEGYNSLARVFYRQNKYEDALEKLTELANLDTNNSEAYYFMGLILNDLKRANEALDRLKIALNLNPTESKFYAQAARSYALKNDFEEAFLYIKEAIDIMPDNINYMKTASEYCAKLGNKQGEDFYKNHAKRLEKISKCAKEDNN